MPFIWLTALKDLRRRRRDPIALLVWIAIPTLILILFSITFGGSGSTKTPQVLLLITDKDASFASGLLVGSFAQGPLKDLFVTEIVAEEDGLRRIEAGEASALLIIPRHFGENLLRQRDTTLLLKTNPAQRILPGIAEEVLGVLVDAVFYFQQLLGTPLNDLISETDSTGRSPSDLSVAGFSVTVKQLVEHADNWLFPPVIELNSEPLEVNPAAEKDASSAGFDGNIGKLFFPGLLFMSILFMGQGLADDLWAERSGGTLSRLITTPHAVVQIVLGKAIAGALVIGGVCAFALVAGGLLYGLDPLRSIAALLWAVFSGLLILSLLMLIQSYASSRRAGSVFSTLIVFPLMMAGGSFFPLDMMPDFLAAFGRWTPNGWSLTLFKDILAGTAEAGAIIGGFVGLGLVSLSLFLLTARRLRLVNTGV